MYSTTTQHGREIFAKLGEGSFISLDQFVLKFGSKEFTSKLYEARYWPSEQNMANLFREYQKNRHRFSLPPVDEMLITQIYYRHRGKIFRKKILKRFFAHGERKIPTPSSF